MKAIELLNALGRKLQTSSQTQLADALGVTPQTIINWKKRDEDLSPNQVASALAKSREAAVAKNQLETVQPIVEYYPISKVRTKQGAAWQIFSSTGSTYVAGVRNALENSNGIYIYYDSRGQALYVGKAREQSLWKEMNLVLNRKRDVQTFKLVDHPERNQEFKPGYEKLRQPVETQLELCDLAYYCSAYKIDDGMIDDLEALLVRGFANNLLNVKMERFTNSQN